MNHTVKVTAKGEVTLPDDVRKALKVEAGGTVNLVRNKDGQFEFRPRGATFADLRGIVKLDRPVTDEELKRWIDEARAREYREEE